MILRILRNSHLVIVIKLVIFQFVYSDQGSSVFYKERARFTKKSCADQIFIKKLLRAFVFFKSTLNFIFKFLKSKLF